MFEKSFIYLEVRQGYIKATELNSRKEVTKSCDGLSHPRTLMGDFVAIEACIKSIVNEMAPKSFMRGPITVFVHLLERAEGGFTNVEVRAFKEAALGAGAHMAKLPNHLSPLTKEQLLAGNFSELCGI